LLLFSRLEWKCSIGHGILELSCSIATTSSRMSVLRTLKEVLIGLIIAFALVVIADLIKARLKLSNVIGL